LEKAVRSYCAAGAAGVGLLALAKPAVAEIIYTPAHERLTTESHLLIDVNHDGATDIVLTNEVNPNTSGLSQSVFASGGINQGAVLTSHTNDALALSRGAPIGSSQPFSIVGFMADRWRSALGRHGSGGNWLDVKNRYLGVRFKINGETHYGWARLNIEVTANAIFTVLTGYAYDTVAGQKILAGQTSNTDTSIEAPTLEAATLGRLALGSTGLESWRGRR
jgi:hypothetical protein